MSGWGASLIGYASTVEVLQSLKMGFADGALYLVGPTVSYAVYQERGTRKMEARPFAKPAAERVQANLNGRVGAMLDGPIEAATEDELVRATALAVQDEMKRIADQKDIRDTGALIASITIEKVS